MASRQNLLPLTIFALISTVACSKLNVPRVLLPIFKDINSKFVLEATDDGCYSWSTTRANIIQLTLIDERIGQGCSSKVIVTAVTKEEARNLAVVLAENVHTKQTLRCDVIVDVIHSLLVATTTRELFMEEAPEAFEIRAYDNQGNEFSTLDGVEFSWKIISLSPTKQASVLRYIPFEDSPYEAPPAIAVLEQENKKGYMVLLEGVKTGSSKVSISLPYPEYKNVAPLEVQLSVVANLILNPVEVYLMAGDVVTLKLYYMNNGRMEEISMPDAQYYLESENKAIALSDKKSALVTALKEGKTKIILHDRNTDKTDPNIKVPAATINVVQPAYMTITVQPYKNWAILIGDRHNLLVEIYSKTDHKLHIGPDVEIQTTVEKFFHVEQRSRNGSWIFGWGVREGTASVEASLISISNPRIGTFKLDTPVTVKGELLIFTRITITPSYVVLPWDPLLKPKYEIDLLATGGDGRFLWSSSNHSVGSVTQSGHVRTYYHGEIEISAAMFRNHYNRQTAKIAILPPSRLEIVEFTMEAEVGSTIYLHLALYAKDPNAQNNEEHIPFTKCQDIQYQVKISDNKFMYNKSDTSNPVGMACATLALKAINIGTSKITVSYIEGETVLEDTVSLTAFLPLKLVLPDKDIVLAVGSSINLVFSGGPKPSLGRPSDFSKIVESGDETIVKAYDSTSDYKLQNYDYTVVTAICQTLGETNIKLILGNNPSLPNCKSRRDSIIVNIICGKPRAVFLQPEIKVADFESCPMDLSADRVIVQSNLDIELLIILHDDLGRKFLNFSSLKLDWTITPKDLGEFVTNEKLIQKPLEIGPIKVADKNFQFVKAMDNKGLIEVNLTVTGYEKAVLKKVSVKAESPPFLSSDEKYVTLRPIEASIGLYLVDDFIVYPKIINAFNHPNNKQVVNIKQGSGFYEIGFSSEDIVDVNYVESMKQINITPLRSGQVTLQINDLCLLSNPAYVLINIVAVGILRVEMSDKVEINRCLECIVRFYDDSDNLMVLPDINMVEITSEMSARIAKIETVPPGSEPLPLGEIHFSVTGLELGDTKLVFSIFNGEKDIKSAPVNLQVFPPLKLHPRNGTILIGSTMQLATQGGPKPESAIEFTVDSEQPLGNVIVDSKGVVTGKAIGASKITAKSVGVHPSTGHKVIYSQDTAQMRVIKLTGMKIAAPLTRFKVGAVVPVWAHGIPEQLSPIVLGAIEDQYLKFNWTFDDVDVIKIYSPFHEIGIAYKMADKVSMRITGLQPGKTTLTLVTTVSGATFGMPNKETVTFTSTIELEVFEALKLIKPPKFSGENILMAPMSYLQFETNLDSTFRILYTLPAEDISNELPSSNSLQLINEVVTVSKTGLLQSHNVLGHALVVITSVDEYGVKQTIHILIEVKPVHYMVLQVHTKWLVYSQHTAVSIPLGTELELRAMYFDNAGNVFTAGPSQLKVKTSRCDLVRVRHGVTNSSVIISTRLKGHTVIKVWSEGVRRTMDYVKLNVKNEIEPTFDYITSGDIICLYTPVTTRLGQPGYWQTSDKGILSVNSQANVAIAQYSRGGRATLTHSLHPAAPLQITVSPFEDIVFQLEDFYTITNTPSSQFYIPLVLISHLDDVNKMNNLVQGGNAVCEESALAEIIPDMYKCFINFSNASMPIELNHVFTIEAGFRISTGEYACVIKPTGAQSPEISILETDLTVWAVSINEDVISDSVNVTFIPSVFVETELTLDQSGDNVDLIVIGLNHVLKEVTVRAAEENILNVDSGYFKEETMLVFAVQLLDYHWKLNELPNSMTLILESPLTSQTVKILVKVAEQGTFKYYAGHSPLYRFLVNYRHLIVVVLVMLIVFAISLYVYSQYMHPMLNAVDTNTSLLQGQRQVLSPSPLVLNRNQISTPNSSFNCATNNHVCLARMNCTCSPRREPVYGDVSSLYNTSSDLRRNRRFM